MVISRPDSFKVSILMAAAAAAAIFYPSNLATQKTGICMRLSFSSEYYVNYRDISSAQATPGRDKGRSGYERKSREWESKLLLGKEVDRRQLWLNYLESPSTYFYCSSCC